MNRLAVAIALALLISTSGCSQPAVDSEHSATTPAGYVSAEKHAALQKRFDALVEELANQRRDFQQPETRHEDLAATLKSQLKKANAELAQLKRERDSSAGGDADSLPTGMPFREVFAAFPPATRDFAGEASVSGREVVVRYPTAEQGVRAYVSFDPKSQPTDVDVFFDAKDSWALNAVANYVATLVGKTKTEVADWMLESRRTGDTDDYLSGSYRVMYDDNSGESSLAQVTVHPIGLYLDADGKPYLGKRFGREAKQHHP